MEDQTQSSITIEQLEALADRLEQEESAERKRLQRLICAYARIIGVREPERFEAQPTRRTDEEGHYDNSFPPDQELSDWSGPRAVCVRNWDSEDIPMTRGFYYEYETVPGDPGLFVDRAGRLWGAAESGKGRFGQFAAHPGSVDVETRIEWSTRYEISTKELQAAEKVMRDLAFPLIAARG